MLVTTLIGLLLGIVLSHRAQARTLSERADQLHSQTLTLDSAQADLQTLEDQIGDLYGYRSYYERALKFQFSRWVDTKRELMRHFAFPQNLENVETRILHKNDVVTILCEAIGIFGDFHTRLQSGTPTVGLPRDPDFTLNLGIYYSKYSKQYRVYLANPQVYAQLAMTEADYRRRNFVIKTLAGRPIEDWISQFKVALPYSTELTNRTNAGLILGTSKGLLHLAYLSKKLGWPIPDDQIPLELYARDSGQTTNVYVSPQALTTDYELSDPRSSVEGRPKSAKPKTTAPVDVASALGSSFERLDSRTGYLKIPSWVADPSNEAVTNKSLYDFYAAAMDQMTESTDEILIIDTMGNRGGTPVLFRPILEAMIGPDPTVVGMIQVDRKMEGIYPSARAAPISEIFKNSLDYLEYSYFLNDPELSPSVRAALRRHHQRMVKQNTIDGNMQIISDPRFSQVLYSVLQRPAGT